MATTTLTSRASAATSSRSAFRFAPLSWIGVSRQRRQLAALDARTLRDMGISDAQARTEANRPFWDVPTHWRG